MSFLPIVQACEILGSQAALARTVGVTPPFVSQWITGDRAVPVRFCTIIEQATGGKVTRKDLRPDDWAQIWPELIDAA